MKKKFLLATIFILLIAVLAFSFTACNKKGNTLESLQNEYGIIVEGGSFEEGSALVSNGISANTEEAAEILAAIADQNYNKNGSVYIFDIYVTKDGTRVQPNGKVKVSVPIPNAQAGNYLVFHVKADNTAEKLVPAVADGKISFEVSSFSYFVIAEELTCETQGHRFGEWMPDKVDEGKHCKECACGEKETADCTFDGGVVTKEPTHSEEGTKTYTCTVCGRTKEESLGKTNEHTFTKWLPSAESKDKHERACACGEKETAD